MQDIHTYIHMCICIHKTHANTHTCPYAILHIYTCIHMYTHAINRDRNEIYIRQNVAKRDRHTAISSASLLQLIQVLTILAADAWS